MSYLRCELLENNEVIKTLTKKTNTDPGELLVSLENFRLTLNGIFTNMIEDNGDIDDYIDEDDNESGSSDESAPMAVSPKKRKK